MINGNGNGEVNARQQAYLTRAYAKLRADIMPEAPEAEKVILSYGFPEGARRNSGVIGECFKADRAPQGYAAAILISPQQWRSSADVLHVLVHEMAHAACATYGHGPEFGKIARRVGLVGALPSTVAGGELTERLNSLAVSLGEFPGAPLPSHRSAVPGELPVFPLIGGIIKCRPKPLKANPGSRLRLWECACVPPVKVRVASDDFQATCGRCNGAFKRAGAKQSESIPVEDAA